MAPNTTNSDMTNRIGELNSPGKLTTWSNLGSGGAGGGTNQIRIIDGKLVKTFFVTDYNSMLLRDMSIISS